MVFLFHLITSNAANETLEGAITSEYYLCVCVCVCDSEALRVGDGGAEQ